MKSSSAMPGFAAEQVFRQSSRRHSYRATYDPSFRKER
jgi:hypothetical protein